MTTPSAAPRPVLVTRPAGRGAALLALLHEAGIEAAQHPLIRLVPASEEELGAARTQLAGGGCTHLVVTSRTAAEALGPLSVPPGLEVVAVGDGTAETLEALGIAPTLVAGGTGAALVARMPPAPAGASVLFPASSAASRTVPEGLRAKGYRVHELTVYRPEPLEPPVAVAVGLATGGFGALVLTSPMIARRAAAHGVHPSTPIVSIGAPTSAAVRAVGLEVALQAAEPTNTALVSAVQQVLAAGPAAPPAGDPAAGPVVGPASTPDSLPRSPKEPR